MTPRKPMGAGPIEFVPRTETPKASRHYARAAALHLDGKPEDALRELQRAITKGEKTADIYSAMALIQFEIGQFEGAVNSYRELVDLDPKNVSGWFNLALCLERMSKWQEASEAFQKTLELNPERTDAFVGLGIASLHLPGDVAPFLRTVIRY